MTDTHTSLHSDSKGLEIGKLTPVAALIGIVGLIASLAHIASDPKMGTGSYLFGLIFWGGLSIGMLALTCLHHAVRGSWTLSIMRLLEAGGGPLALTVVGLLFSPVVFGVFSDKGSKSPYEWADPAKVAADKALQHKALIMNPGFWSGRVVIFFAMFVLMAWFLRNSTHRQDKSGDFKLEAGRSTWGAIFLPIFVLAVTFAMTDWVMSLNPHWYSTMFGPWTLIGATLAALAFSTLIVTTNYDRAPYAEIVGPKLTKDLGNMLFAFTMLWGYTSLSQFLIIWNGNLPETASYFMTRSSAIGNRALGAMSWAAMGLLTVIGQFFVPFFALLAPRTKRFSVNLRKIAGWIFVIHIFDVYLLVIPAIPGRDTLGPISGHILWDLLSFIGIGGIWLAVFASQTRKAPLVVKYDTRLQEAMHAH